MQAEGPGVYGATVILSENRPGNGWKDQKRWVVELVKLSRHVPVGCLQVGAFPNCR